MKTFIIVITSLFLFGSFIYYPLETIEIIGWVVLSFFVFMYLIAFPLLSRKNILFGRYKEDHIKMVSRGDKFQTIFNGIGPKEEDGDHYEIKFNPVTRKLERGEQGNSAIQTLLKSMFGMFWIGNIFTDRVKMLPIQKKKAVQTAKDTDPIASWVTEEVVEDEDNIRWRPQRVIVLPQVEFRDGKSAANFMITLELELENAITAGYTLNGKFYTLIDEKAGGEFLERMAKFANFAECIAAGKSDPNYSGLFDKNSPFNVDLLKSTGYRLRDFIISKRQIIDELAEATLAQENARLLGEATITAQTAKSNARRIEAEGEEEYIMRTEGAKVKAVVDQLKLVHPNATPEQLIPMVTDYLGKSALSKIPNLSTLVTDLLRK